jgi:hypothetical protein
LHFLDPKKKKKGIRVRDKGYDDDEMMKNKVSHNCYIRLHLCNAAKSFTLSYRCFELGGRLAAIDLIVPVEIHDSARVELLTLLLLRL